MEIALALLGSGALATVISWLLHRIDRKQDKQDQIISGMAALDNKLQQHIDSDERYRTDMCRIRILRFSDELRRGVNHSEESFNNVLEDIDNYTEYCVEHEDVYINSKADAAIRNIKSVHDRCIRGDLKFL